MGKKVRRSRARQNERAGCFTDADGYKRQVDAKGAWQSGDGAGQLLPPTTRWPTIDRITDYPCEGEQAIMTRAIKKRWPVTPEIKQAVVQTLEGCLAHTDPIVAIGAARVLVAAEKQNQDDKIKRQTQRQTIAVQQILQLAEPSAPDPEYVAWKQGQLIAAGAQTAAQQEGGSIDPPSAPLAGFLANRPSSALSDTGNCPTGTR